MLVKLSAFILCLLTFTAQAAAPSNPYQLVKYVADKTLTRIDADAAKIKAHPDHLKQLVAEEMMPYIDHKLAAKFILDKTEADDASKDMFNAAFERYLITTYATLFSQYEGQKLTVEHQQSVEGKKVVGVATKLQRPNQPPATIEFKLRYNKQQSQWAVFDMVVEGVSLLNSKKAELKPLLRQPDGLANVIKQLNEKANSTIVL